MTEELLTIQEVAERLRIKPDTVREKMRLGLFKKGVHYYRRKGMRPLFRWNAVLAWLEGKDQDQEGQRDSGAAIPMAKRYTLGGRKV